MERQSSHEALQEGTILHQRFCVKKIIGMGGFGITYLGEDILLKSLVAIKEYMPEGFFRGNLWVNETEEERTKSFQEGLKGFLEEARLLSRCQEWEGIVSIRDFFEENGTAYLVMDYLSGISVKERVQTQGAIPEEEALRLMKPVIYSLGRLHKVGYLHRDISSDNLLFTSQNQLKLIDFGSARPMNPLGEATRTVMFKRGFAGEEQYRTKGKQGPWTDVYGICASLYHMLTGEVPIEAVERVIEDSVVPLAERGEIKLSPKKKETIDKGMAVFGKNRYQSMDELYEALYEEKVMDGSVGEMASFEKIEELTLEIKKEEHRGERIRQANFLATRTEFLQKRKSYHQETQKKRQKKMRRHRVAIGMVLLLVFGGLTGSLIYYWHGQQQKTESSVERRQDKDTDTLSQSEKPETTPSETPVASEKNDQEEKVSQKDEKVLVPNVVSKKKTKAVKLLQQQGFEVKVTYDYHGTMAKGKVISQSVKAGKKVKPGKMISLVVSKGKKQTPQSTPSTQSKSADRQSDEPSVAGDITNLFE